MRKSYADMLLVRMVIAVFAAIGTLPPAIAYQNTICQVYTGRLNPQAAHSMHISYSSQSGGTGNEANGQYGIYQTWSFNHMELPDSYYIKVNTVKQSNSDTVFVTLSDRDPPHRTVFQITRKSSDRQQYTILGPYHECTFQYSGFGSELLDVAAYTV